MQHETRRPDATSAASTPAIGSVSPRRELILVRDWAQLDKAQTVWARSAGWPDMRGRIDEVTADGAMAWVLTDGDTRRLHHRADGVELLIERDQTSLQHPI